jgi:hypothetical protein
MSLIGINRKDYKPNNEYFTPQWIFDKLGLMFDLDVAAPEGGVPWLPCKNFLTSKDDGLKTEWHGMVWMNPPYSQCVPWVEKFMQHGNGIALLPTSKAAWFKRLFDHPDVHVLHPSQNVRFATPANEIKGIFMPTLLFAMGEISYQALVNSKLGRVR